MSYSDFEIKNGILKKYKGNDEIVRIPDGVTIIDDYAFDFCSSLKKIIIPDCVTKINYRAFSCCSSLKEIIIPDSVTEIEKHVFQGCDSLEEIIIPSGVTKIEFGTFRACKSLEKVTIPNSVTEIKGWAFSQCSYLEEINIPDSVTKIGLDAFKECLSLEVIYAPKGLDLSKTRYPKECQIIRRKKQEKTKYAERTETPEIKKTESETKSVRPDENKNDFVIENGVFKKYTGSEETVHIPDNVTEIGNWAFNGCKNVKVIYLPSKVTKVGVGAFFCKSIEKIYAPKGLDFGNTTFGCEKIYNSEKQDNNTISLEADRKTGKCHDCGSENPENAKFCNNCGAKLN